MTPEKVMEKIASKYSKKITGIIGKLRHLQGTTFPLEIDVEEFSGKLEFPDGGNTNIMYVITAADIPADIGKLYKECRDDG